MSHRDKEQEEVRRLKAELTETKRLEIKARDFFLLEQKSRERIQEERDRLRAELDHSATHKALQALAAENARLRAVLEETPENIEIVVDAIFGASLTPQDMEIQERIYAKWRRDAVQALAALRAKAGLPFERVKEGIAEEIRVLLTIDGEHATALAKYLEEDHLMDPNATLTELRDVIAGLALSSERDIYLCDAIANRFEALDEWLTKGGFLPDAWNVRRGPKRAP